MKYINYLIDLNYLTNLLMYKSNNTINNMRRELEYKLLKDTPTRKAGTIFYKSANNKYINVGDDLQDIEIYTIEEVENNIEWFEPIFKVGDWVINTKNNIYYIDFDEAKGLTELNIRSSYHIAKDCLTYSLNYRLATKEEILKVFPFIVGDVVYNEIDKINYKIVSDGMNTYNLSHNCVNLQYVIDNYWTKFIRKANYNYLPYTLSNNEILNFDGEYVIYDNKKLAYSEIKELYYRYNDLTIHCTTLDSLHVVKYKVSIDVDTKIKIDCLTFTLRELREIYNITNSHNK
jgi:hypothetical protein